MEGLILLLEYGFRV